MYYQLHTIPMDGISSVEEFVETGRIIPINVFKDNFPNEKLHVDCANVIVYAGSHYIQILKTAEFFTDGISDKNLDIVEAFMWKNII